MSGLLMFVDGLFGFCWLFILLLFCYIVVLMLTFAEVYGLDFFVFGFG